VLHVDDMRDPDAATWDRLLRESPGGGHVLQTHAWGAFKATRGWVPLRVALTDAGEVRGVGQILVRRMPGAGVSVAYCPKGPWIDWSNADETRAMLRGMERVAREHGASLLKIESELTCGPGQPTTVPPSVEGLVRRTIALARTIQHPRLLGQSGAVAEGRAGVADDDGRVAEARAALRAMRARQALDGRTPGRRVFTERGFVKARWDPQFRTTMLVDLDRPPEEMLARMKGKWRYNIALARRKGVTVVEDNSPAARRTLYDLYTQTVRRNGLTGGRPWAYAADSWGAMIDAGHAHIFLAYHGGRPLAGVLASTFGSKVWYQVGASATEGRAVMPAHALQFHVMRWAWERGLGAYDLVAIPNVETIGARDPMWGLYVFKSGFGGYPVEWVGCLDKALGLRGHAWEALEPAYYRLYTWRAGDILY
jgi:lipid II:glycine glycyltransferase (peptidoglycan interpeptide bridge formation enzyme)